MNKSLILASMLFLISLPSGGRVSKQSINSTRIKELIHIKGVRSNPLVGYGVVTGLNGTGDSKSEIANATFKKIFSKLGLNLTKEIDSKNVAVVLVSATLPEFSRIGNKLNVKVSSIGDAKSLAGGNLVVTPLKGGDGKIYAIASGSISVGGINSQSSPTTGIISNGGIIEKELKNEFSKKKNLRISLKKADFTTAARVEKSLNQGLGGIYAKALDSSTIDLIVPPSYEGKVVQLLAIIENFRVIFDTKAKIVINERTGTIVAGGDVTLRPVAISHGELNISIGNKKDDGISILHMEKQTTLKEFVEGLNNFGVKPDDIISIFQALEKSGSLVGEIEFI